MAEDLFFLSDLLFLSWWESPGNSKYLTLHSKTSLETKTVAISLILGAREWKQCFPGLLESVSLQKRSGVRLIKGSHYLQGSKQCVGFSVLACEICD